MDLVNIFICRGIQPDNFFNTLVQKVFQKASTLELIFGIVTD